MITFHTIGRASLALTLSVVVLTGCGAPPAIAQPNGATATATASAEQTATTPAETTTQPTMTVEPVSTDPAQAGTTAECAALQSGIASIVRTDVAQTEAPLDDSVSGATLQGCQLTAQWTGAHLDNFVAVSQQASALLVEQGWSEDQRYAADGPTGTVLGFARDGQLAILRIDWQPGAEVQCPADRPISDCEMLPEQRHYTLSLAVANTEI